MLLDLDLAAVKPAEWKKIVDGDFFKPGEACAAAEAFAARNDAKATLCQSVLPRFIVEVETNGTVGDSVVPGTGAVRGRATATALIESRCQLGAVPTPSPTPTTPPGDSSAAPTPTPATVNFTCGGELVRLDPLNPGKLSALTRKLFSVRLDG
ncbi:hypothetical protein [Streptomyces sp. NPDC056544]|uniref:hypothetical protein n=1 Tax=unclassified Streptomyces TaxID=2593676 RepID=UPI0036841129